MNEAATLDDDDRLDRLEEAATWLQRMRLDAGDGRVMEACVDWCQRDPRNQQAFDEMASLWELTGRVQIAPVVAPREARGSSSRRWALAASLAGLGFAALSGVWMANRTERVEVVSADYETPIGVNTTQRLADGSMLDLGGGTRVTVSIGPRTRRVALHEGEVFATVHHDTHRPFAVDAGRLEVVATGTAFNVLRTRERTTVTVAEGSVAASYEGQRDTVPNVHLQTRQQLVYNHGSRSVMVRQADPLDVSAWRSGSLRFQNELLSEVIATLNRYAAAQIVIEDPAVRALSFTGTARADRIPGWLAGLPLVFPVEVAQLPDGRQLIRARSGAVSD
jgi:transmembrane sensor